MQLDLVAIASLTVLFASQLSAQTAPAGVAGNAPPSNETSESVLSTSPRLPTGTPSFRFIPTVEVNERFSDNAALEPASFARNDWITNAAVHIHIGYQAARANALVDYRVNREVYGKLSGLDNTQHWLDSSATAELVEKWLLVDARASINQEKRSAFGSSTISNFPTNSPNRIETTVFQVAPYIRGNLRDSATYLLRVNATETRTGDIAFPDSRAYLSTGFIKNTASTGRMGWSIDGTALTINNRAVGKLVDNRARATLTYELDTQMHLSLSGGREISNLDSADKRTTNTPGFGLEWSPSQRTQFAIIGQKRFYGNENIVDFSHRTALTAWHLSSSKEVAISTNEISTTNPTSVHNVLLNLLASAITDPVARTAAVQRRFEQTGMPKDSGFEVGYLSVRPFVHWRQDASVALLGTRNTITLSAGRREQRAIGDSSAGIGAPVEEIRESSINFSWTYRLSPVSNLRLAASKLRTVGLFNENRKTDEQLYSLFFVTHLGSHTSASLGYQRVQLESTVEVSYRENAFVSAISLRF